MLKMNRAERLRLLSVPVEKMSIAMQNLSEQMDLLKSEIWKMEDQRTSIEEIDTYIQKVNRYYQMTQTIQKMKWQIMIYNDERFPNQWNIAPMDIDIWERSMNYNRKLELITDAINHSFTETHYKTILKRNRKMLLAIIRGDNEEVMKLVKDRAPLKNKWRLLCLYLENYKLKIMDEYINRVEDIKKVELPLKEYPFESEKRKIKRQEILHRVREDLITDILMMKI